MARKVRNSLLETRSARLKLAVRRKPYSGSSLGRGMALLYRRNKTNGTWVAKVSDGHGAYWTKAFAEADDFDGSDGKNILTFYEAQDQAKKLARRQPGDVGDDSRPVTVDEALTAYEADLEARGANTYNARQPRALLSALLLGKPVQLLDSKELRKWRDGLLGKMKPASVVRTCKNVRAALALAASHDQRIQNKDAWEIGLESLPDSAVARNVILDDATVGKFINAAYAREHQFGLLIETLAVTGSRPSQVSRLLVEDLHTGTKPKLSMPRSAKGGSKDRTARREQRVSVPITPALATKLKAAAKGRAVDAPLLVQANGSAWGRKGRDPAQDYRHDVREIVTGLGLDADKVTAYALRHSSIVRMLLKNVNIRLVASLHDTSVSMVEKHYARFIDAHGDDIARAALLHHEPAAIGDNVIPIVGGR
jgi:integrase